ncbi:hypothetical protein EIZ39_24465 [Ammoniphilus sp. CFH 90114]|nr:hypothetical protein EIZ39_24465 [Ammoniphilus sp. CFH 90114]
MPKTATTEVSFFNGVDEHIIQTIMWELKKKSMKRDYTHVKNIYIVLNWGNFKLTKPILSTKGSVSYLCSSRQSSALPCKRGRF